MDAYEQPEGAGQRKMYRYVCYVKGVNSGPDSIVGSEKSVEVTFVADAPFDRVSAVSFEIANRFGFDKRYIDVEVKSIEEIVVG